MWVARGVCLLLVVMVVATGVRALEEHVHDENKVPNDVFLCLLMAGVQGQNNDHCQDQMPGSGQDSSKRGTAIELPEGRRKRQVDPASNFDDEQLQCILLANLEGRDPAECKGLNNDRLMCLFRADAEGTDAKLCDTTTPSCTCVPFWQCRDNDINPGPEASLLNVVNVRINALVCGRDQENQVCCENVDHNGTPPTPSPEPYTARCGYRQPDGFNTNFQGFVDRQAQFGEFPWMAAVMTSELDTSTNANFYICGGSLIHPSVVMTAAHYVHDKQANQLMVRLGEWNFKEPSETVLHQDLRVKRILIHPKFHLDTIAYDVALLFLEGSATLGETVDTICLPEPGENFSGPGCFSSGWGKDSFGSSGAYQQILKSIELPAVSNPDCQAALQTTRLGPFFLLDDSFMCAGGLPGDDVCTGDGGSPLVCPMKSDPTRYVQAGIVAWGIGCGQDGIPGVYAAVSRAVTWIDQEMQGNHDFDIRQHLRVNTNVGGKPK